MEQLQVATTNEECIELKNIKYKTKMMGSKTMNTKEFKSESDLVNLEKFLEDNKLNEQHDSWSKLDNTVKTKKLLSYAEMYTSSKELDANEHQLLITFLKECLDRKRLHRVKDVDYDKETGKINDIPALMYTKPTKHFTLKNLEKRVSTLKSLPPKKTKNVTPTKRTKSPVI